MNHKPTIPQEPCNTSTERTSDSYNSIGDFDDNGVIDFVDFVKIARIYEE